MELHPDTHYTAFNSLGKLLHVRGDVAEAEANYRRALAIVPRYDTALYNLATLLHTNPSTNPQTETGEASDASSEAGPKPRPGPGPGRAARLAEAVELYRRSLNARPTPEAHYNLATLLLNQRGLEVAGEAMGHLEDALRLNAHHKHARATLGQVRAVVARKKGKGGVGAPARVASTK